MLLLPLALIPSAFTLTYGIEGARLAIMLLNLGKTDKIVRDKSPPALEIPMMRGSSPLPHKEAEQWTGTQCQEEAWCSCRRANTFHLKSIADNKSRPFENSQTFSES